MVKFRKMLINDKGFTLIELLVVIAVLGILAAIAIPRLTGVTDRAREQNLISGGNSIRSTIEMVIAEAGVFPSFDYTDGDTTLTVFADTDDSGGLTDDDVQYDVSIDTNYTFDGTGSHTTDSYTVTLSDASENTVNITNSGVSLTN